MRRAPRREYGRVAVEVSPTPVLQQAYDRSAAAYAERLDPTLASPVARLAELAGAAPGVRVLDVATGTGSCAAHARRRGADVIAVDVSARMLEIARRRDPGLDVRRADVHALPALPFDDGTFDAVTCGLAVSHFRFEALREIVRVLRGGGRLVALTWGRGDATAFFGPVREALERHGARDVYRLDEATWMDADAGTEVLRRAGFDPVDVVGATYEGRFSDADEALAWVMAWPLVAARVAQLDVGTRAAALAEARDAVGDTDLAWRLAMLFYVAVQPATLASQHEHSV
jgi:SAM-dependent methyltransferase